MTWLSMETAPKGGMKTVSRKIGKNVVEMQAYDAPTIIAAGPDGVTVCLTRWIENEGRWNMFSKAHPPIAWQPFPKHPNVAEAAE